MDIQDLPNKVRRALPVVTTNGNYDLNEVYNFIDVCRNEKMFDHKIATLLNVEPHRITYFEQMRHVYDKR